MGSAVDPSRLPPVVPLSRTGTGLGRARALSALGQVGIPATNLHRVPSVTNEVWLTDDYVVRVNRDASMRLRREAVLSNVLPDGVQYPGVVQYGGEPGSDWLILPRVPGRPLSRWWPTMTEDDRRSAVRQVADRLRLVHATPCPRLDGLHDVPQLLDPAERGSHAVGRLLDALRRASSLPHVDAGIMSEASGFVLELADVLDPFDQKTLVHGDLTFENVLWDGEKVTAILDFEFARPGPPDLDLDVLLRFAALPHLHVAPDYEDQTRAEDYEALPWWLAEDYPELFAHPRQFDRTRLYSLAWDVREMLAYPPLGSQRSLHPFHPYRRIIRVLRGTSYLDKFNGKVVLEY